MHLIAVGTKGKDLAFIGLAKKPKETFDSLVKASADTLVFLDDYELATGWDSLALLLVERQLSSFKRANGWFAVHASHVRAAVSRAYRATQVKKSKPYKFGDVIRHLRTKVFGTNQDVIAEIAGCVASTVSRWESNAVEPTLADIKRLRDFAYANGLLWDDALIWEMPDARTPHIETEIGVAP